MGDDDGPLFEVGEHVIVINPLVIDGVMMADEDSVIHTQVKRIAYVVNLGIYAYELEGLDGWYNENWLKHDVYLPKKMNITELSEPKKSIDELLDELNDYIALYSEFGDDEYKTKIEAIKAELREMRERHNRHKV